RYRDEFRIRDEQAGGWRWVLSRGRAMERDEEGLPLRVVGLMSDISRRREREAERSRLEAQLRHVQKLDALGQLTGGIAHDFNNILASVLGYAELGIMALGDSSEQVTGYMREIRSAADRGRELISKMLLFSRGNAGADEGLRVAPVSLIDDTVRMLRPMLPATLTVETVLAPGLPPLGLEPTHLQQLLLNLTINARDAVGENGSVQIRAEAAQTGPALCASCGAAFSVEEGFLCLSVGDDGPGIPEHILANVFDPFFSTKETGRGSGLGLSVVHGIVHDHGGHIMVESSDDGTLVRLLIPVATAEEPLPQVQILPPVTEGRGRHVLVVDDELAIGRWMAALLEMRGFVVDIYDNPRMA
ncbi:MAG TPA: ATP-binding protein, partial [Gammaproteobacteria bacterium]|nr:ATP-binding protein [Gammaproteobacteria bacterium]